MSPWARFSLIGLTACWGPVLIAGDRLLAQPPAAVAPRPTSAPAEQATDAASLPARLVGWLGPQAWVKDLREPILTLGDDGDFDDMHVFAPAVAVEDGRFAMWYSGSRGNRGERVFRLGLATGPDGVAFIKYPGNPVFELADGARSALTPAPLRRADGTLLRERGRIRLWFAAADLRNGGRHTLHETTSADGITWDAPTDVLLDNVYCPTVIKSGERYLMWYADVSRRPWVIRHACSADGRQWTVLPEPVLGLSQAWEAEILVYPTVVQIDDVYLLWYGSYWNSVRRQTTAIGFAASVDGVHWYKHPDNPVMTPDADRPWESNYVGSGCVARLEDGRFRYWYASRTKPPFVHLYYAINTAHWAGPTAKP